MALVSRAVERASWAAPARAYLEQRVLGDQAERARHLGVQHERLLAADLRPSSRRRSVTPEGISTPVRATDAGPESDSARRSYRVEKVDELAARELLERREVEGRAGGRHGCCRGAVWPCVALLAADG